VNIVVLCPHFEPDVAPTGEVMTSIARELVALGHRLHVVTSLPWYQRHALEPGWDGQLVRHAVAVIVLTEWTKADVVARIGIDPRRVLLVPPGLDPMMPVDPDVARDVRERYEIGDAPFFLYPTITYAHKNHVGLVRAFARVTEADDRVLLVLTGGAADAEEAVQLEVALGTQGTATVEGVRRLALTERELQVLRGMADGKSNAEIGRELFVSEDTVKTHARRLFRKLGARDRAHAVAAAFRAGLVR
jgi:DNA-binding CsgD family transcriptional regulator